MFGTNWSTFVDARVKQSHIQQFFQIQGQITPDVLVRFVPCSNSSETLWAYKLGSKKKKKTCALCFRRFSIAHYA